MEPTELDGMPAAEGQPTVRDPEEGVLDGTMEELAEGCYRRVRLPAC